jgi:small subunit ribosomal protein S8
MSLTDPVADMLTRIRNALQVKKKDVNIPSSRMKVEIAKILKDEGYIKNFRIAEDSKQGILNLTLKYTNENESVITEIQRTSRPGCRIYCNKGSIPKVLGGMGIVILSTSEGVTTGKKCKELGVGGEVLCYIW